jgi:small redox-active disulfide protein 2
VSQHIIKILGKGCGNCIWTERLVREVIAQAGVDASVEKITKTSEMLPYGIMATPAIVIDEHVVHSGGIPTRQDVERWIEAIKS